MSIQPLVDHYRNTEVGHHLQRLGREQGREEERRRCCWPCCTGDSVTHPSPRR
jgi:hypothetical protein